MPPGPFLPVFDFRPLVGFGISPNLPARAPHADAHLPRFPVDHHVHHLPRRHQFQRLRVTFHQAQYLHLESLFRIAKDQSPRSFPLRQKHRPTDGTYNVDDPADEAAARQNGRLGEDGHSDNEIPVTITENPIQGRPNPITGARANGMAMASPGNGVTISGSASLGPHGVQTLPHEVGHYGGYRDETNTRDPACAHAKKGRGII